MAQNHNKMLDKYENKVFSQFGEDGITDYIFTKIGTGKTLIFFFSAAEIFTLSIPTPSLEITLR